MAMIPETTPKLNEISDQLNEIQFEGSGTEQKDQEGSKTNDSERGPCTKSIEISDQENQIRLEQNDTEQNDPVKSHTNISKTVSCHFDKKDDRTFYKKAQIYWSSVEPTVDGMLGGFSSIHKIDITGSASFLQDIFKLKPTANRKRALDCGAGIGRVTKHFLGRYFDEIDLVEQDEAFSKQIQNYVGTSCSIGQIFNKGLQDFEPEPGKYDVIWSQWVLGHLTDNHLEAFFKRCIRGLSKNGIIIVKENITSAETEIMDEVDCSVTRPLISLKRIIIKSGLRVVKLTRQHSFPADLFPVYMIALRPAKILKT